MSARKADPRTLRLVSLTLNTLLCVLFVVALVGTVAGW